MKVPYRFPSTSRASEVLAKRWIWIAAGVAVVVLLWLLAGLSEGSVPALALFVGRFHPSLVHFPIAFLVLAAVIEMVAMLRPQFEGYRTVVPFVLVLGAAASVLAALAGYLLTFEGGVQEGLVDRHMWLGFVVAAGACAGVVLERLARRGRLSATPYRSVVMGTAVLVLVTGHFGSTLTRGEGYLTFHLPDPIKRLVGLSIGPRGLIADIDSAFVYQDLIAPVMERRCVKCHGAARAREGLRLDAPEYVQQGSNRGPIVAPGQPEQSELYRRVVLPPFHTDAMPPEGETPLTVAETELLRWWIANGASFDLRVGDVEEVPTSVEVHLARISAPRETVRRGIFAHTIHPPDTAALALLRSAGVGVRVLMDEAPFLDVTTTNVRSRFGDAEMVLLRPLGEQVTWLDLSGTDVTDVGLAELSRMTHLTRLHLQQTSITDAGLVHLQELSHLEYLNLYGTSVTDDGLEHLAGLTGLRSLYLWQTDVTDEGAERLRRLLPRLEINRGSTLVDAELPEPDDP